MQVNMVLLMKAGFVTSEIVGGRLIFRQDAKLETFISDIPTIAHVLPM